MGSTSTYLFIPTYYKEDYTSIWVPAHGTHMLCSISIIQSILIPFDIISTSFLFSSCWIRTKLKPKRWEYWIGSSVQINNQNYKGRDTKINKSIGYAFVLNSSIIVMQYHGRHIFNQPHPQNKLVEIFCPTSYAH